MCTDVNPPPEEEAGDQRAGWCRRLHKHLKFYFPSPISPHRFPTSPMMTIMKNRLNPGLEQERILTKRWLGGIVTQYQRRK